MVLGVLSTGTAVLRRTRKRPRSRRNTSGRVYPDLIRLLLALMRCSVVPPRDAALNSMKDMLTEQDPRPSSVRASLRALLPKFALLRSKEAAAEVWNLLFMPKIE